MADLKIDHLERIIESMKYNYESVTLECRRCQETIDDLENKLEQKSSEHVEVKVEPSNEEMQAKVNKLESVNKELNGVKNNLEVRLEKVSKELKSVQQLKEEVSEENSSLEKCLNKQKREQKDAEHILNKKIDALNDKIKDLNAFKEAKLVEEKEMKAQTKKLEKKAKFLTEKEVSLEIKQKKIEKDRFQASSHESKCDHCEVKLKSLEELNTHVKACHLESESSQTVAITLMDKLVQTEGLAVEEPSPEKKNNHLEFKKYHCFYCSFKITSKLDLESHIKVCRQQLAPPPLGFICKECRIICDTENQMLWHEITTHGPFATKPTEMVN